MHFSYLQDPKNPHRRLTIARDIQEDKVVFGMAMNKCVDGSTYSSFSSYAQGKGHSVELRVPQKRTITYAPVPVDVFNRKLGRAIAGGLAAKKGITLPIVEGEAPLATVLKYLLNAEDQSHVVKRIAEAHLHAAPVSV